MKPFKIRKYGSLSTFLAVALLLVTLCAAPTSVMNGTQDLPSITPTPIAIGFDHAAPGKPVLHVISRTINIRAGPGTDYPILGTMKTGNQADTVGRNASTSWWLIQTDVLRGWITNNPAFIQITGSTADIPLVASPPIAVLRPSQTVTPVPDLFIDHITLDPVTPMVDQPFTVSVGIGNRGSADGKIFTVACTVDKFRQTVEVPPIKAGTSMTLKFRFTLHQAGVDRSAACRLFTRDIASAGKDTWTFTFSVVGSNELVLPTATPVRLTPDPGTGKGFDLGIVVQENEDPSAFKVWARMVTDMLKLNWIKLSISWRDIEAAKRQRDFSSLDVELPILAQANVKVLLTISKAPLWALDTGARPRDKNASGPPQHLQDWADFLMTLLNRYPHKIQAIQVWNEINLDREWRTVPQQLDPERYVDLLKTAQQTIKGIDPNILVISAALAPTGANVPGRAVDDFQYLDLLIKAGMLDYADCVGVHHPGFNVPPDADAFSIPERIPPAQYRGPWSNPNHSWAFKTTLTGYAELIKAANSPLKLCVTEFGWPTMEGLRGRIRPGMEFVTDNTPEDQAEFTDQAIILMQQWGFVRLAFLDNLNYAAQAGWNLEQNDPVAWSILGLNFEPHPVWEKIKSRDFRSKNQ